MGESGHHRGFYNQAVYDQAMIRNESDSEQTGISSDSTAI